MPFCPQPFNEPIESYGPNCPKKTQLKEEIQRQKQEPKTIPMVIGGEKVFSNQLKAIYAPHEKTRMLGQSCQGERHHVEKAISAALEAKKNWENMPLESRCGIFLKAADLLTQKHRHRVNAATMLGQSKNCYQSEIDAICEMADFFRFQASYAMDIQHSYQPLSPKGQWNQLKLRPLDGFIWAIGPFNFTSIAMNLAFAPALMGNTVLWKPAHPSLLATSMLLEILEEVGLPPGVINLISGDPEMISSVTLQHKKLSGIHFTGSTKVFETLWSQVGSRISQYDQYPRLVGETGGKDFIFAHTSADPEALISAIIRGGFEYQGQKCSASSRIYIPKSLWPRIKDSLIDRTQNLAMGSPEDFRNFVCGVIDQRAYDKITGYIKRGVSDPKVKLLCGGEYSDQVGYFIKPTIFLVEDPLNPLMVEEIFGPVVTIYLYDESLGLDGALKLCDESSIYSLTGAIFAQDRRVIQELSQKLTFSAGNFYINDKPTGAVVGQQPFGGSRKSGTNDKAGSVFHLFRWISPRTIKENLMPVIDHVYPHMSCE